MPWTFAHPAAVLPLRRWSKHLPFTGLVVGSMAPDFGYYTGHFEFARAAHQPLGLLAFCLPTGLLVVLLLRWLRRPVIELLPQPHRAALRSLPAAAGPPTVRELLALGFAVVIGAATHATWDSFTHSHGFAVQHLPFLQQLLFQIGARQFHLFNTLQHASSVLGAVCLAVVYARWLRQAPPPPACQPDGHDPARIKVLLACLIASVLLALPLAAAVVSRTPGPLAISLVGIRTLIFATSFAAVLIPLAALLWARWHGNVR